MNRTQIEALVAEQVEAIEQPELIACVASRLVSPRIEHRRWDYGDEGETHPCWICLEDRTSNTAIAYYEKGFGPHDPWGLLFIEGKSTSMGMDSSWFLSLEDAARESPYWQGENPSDYEVG